MPINWEEANNEFGKAISEVRKKETLQDGIEKFDAILEFIKKQEETKDADHKNRIAELHILLNKCIVNNAKPKGKCFEEVAKLNRLLLGEVYTASENFLLEALSATYKKHSKYYNLTPKILWAIGRLNFRLHNFEEAKLFLHEAAQSVDTKEKFPVYALLAYACEYSGHPSEAIKVLLGDKNPIFSLPFCTKLGSNKNHLGYCTNCCNHENVACKHATGEESLFKKMSELFVSNEKDVKDIKKKFFVILRTVPLKKYSIFIKNIFLKMQTINVKIVNRIIQTIRIVNTKTKAYATKHKIKS